MIPISQKVKHIINLTVRVYTEVREENWFQYISDYVKSIYSAINSRGFKILKEGQNENKFHSYSIIFQPDGKDYEFNHRILEFQIDLRDHPCNSEANGSVIRDYYIANELYDEMLAALRKIWRILDDLQKSDFNSFSALSQASIIKSTQLTVDVNLCTCDPDRLSVDLTGHEIGEHVLCDTDYATRAILGEFYDRGYDLGHIENNWPYSRKIYLDDGSWLEVNLSETACQVDSSFHDIEIRQGEYGIYNVFVNGNIFDNIWEAIDFATECICVEGENK